MDMLRSTNQMLLMMVIFSIITTIPAYAQWNKERVTMSVGETKILDLPLSVTSKYLKSVEFYSKGISFVQVIAHTFYNVTVKAIKASSSPIIVRCDYFYFKESGQLYRGVYEYYITVVGSGSGSGSGSGGGSGSGSGSGGDSGSGSGSGGDSGSGSGSGGDSGSGGGSGVQQPTPTIVLSDKDGVSKLPAKANVIYERTLYSGWNSVCVPFAINRSMLSNFCKDCKIAMVEGSNRFLLVSEVQSVKAGEPCLVYVPQDVTCKFCLSEVSLSTTPQNTGKLRGVYAQTTIGANYYKLTSDGRSLGLTKTDEAIVAPFRACILLDENSQTKVSAEPIKIKVTQVEY